MASSRASSSTQQRVFNPARILLEFNELLHRLDLDFQVSSLALAVPSLLLCILELYLPKQIEIISDSMRNSKDPSDQSMLVKALIGMMKSTMKDLPPDSEMLELDWNLLNSRAVVEGDEESIAVIAQGLLYIDQVTGNGSIRATDSTISPSSVTSTSPTSISTLTPSLDRLLQRPPPSLTSAASQVWEGSNYFHSARPSTPISRSAPSQSTSGTPRSTLRRMNEVAEALLREQTRMKRERLEQQAKEQQIDRTSHKYRSVGGGYSSDQSSGDERVNRNGKGRQLHYEEIHSRRCRCKRCSTILSPSQQREYLSPSSPPRHSSSPAIFLSPLQATSVHSDEEYQEQHHRSVSEVGGSPSKPSYQEEEEQNFYRNERGVDSSGSSSACTVVLVEQKRLLEQEVELLERGTRML